MKMLLLAVAMMSAAIFSTEQAEAQAGSSNVSFGYYNTRQFNTTRTDSSLGCTFATGSTCQPPSCYKAQMKGFSTAGKACCDYYYYCRADGTPDESVAQAIEAQITAEDQQVAEVFRDDNSRVEAYWGYVSGTTNRSPSGGRGNSGPARLDACIGHGETDLLGTGSSDWMTCYSKCDSTTNGYCNNTATNNGSSMTNASCKDRCDCTITGFGTCEGL